jgi:uncharacterized membrane protein
MGTDPEETMKKTLVAACIALAGLAGGCATWNQMNHTEKGVAVGATGGAVVGAVLAGPIGAAIGAGVGGYAGHHESRR